MMYEDIGKMNTSLLHLQEALKKNERLLGEEHIQTTVIELQEVQRVLLKGYF